MPVQSRLVIPSLARPDISIALHPHPATPSRRLHGIEVRLARDAAAGLGLRYVLHGDVAGLRIPEAGAASFADRLWQRTCCEAFLAAASGRYCEINLSPSKQFAIYAFDAYRSGMTPLTAVAPPRIEVLRAEREVILDARVEIDALPVNGHLRIGLAAVVEEVDGTLSYWALAHPAPKPDFHHPDAFVLALPPVGEPA